MRKFFLLMVALSLSLALNANNKLSAPTRVFLQERASGVVQSTEGKSLHATPKTVNGVEYIECFIDLKGSSVAELEANGVMVTGKFSNMVTASVPVDKLDAVARLKSVKQVGISRVARLKTDVAQNTTNAAKAWNGTSYGLPQGYTGKDVVLGIIDDGIQFNHRAFLKEDGTSRVKAVYMPNARSANGGSKATVDGSVLMGYEYTTPELIANLTTDDSSESHGTHTTGCAAGSKIEYTSGKYYAGMAPEADLVLAGCGSGLTEVAIVSSAKYIANYAKNVLGKPCVISISLGSDTGPHDGTSSICRAYAEVAEQYGAVILLAAGNEADITGAAVKTLSSDDDYMAIMHKSYYGISSGGECDIWNSTSDQLQVKVIVGSNQSDWMTSGTYNNVSVQGGVDSSNGHYNLYIKSTREATYVIKGKAGNVIHAYTDCYYSQLGTSGSSGGYTVTPGTYENSMCDDMTSPKVISVGAMCTRSNAGNSPYSSGDVAYFSSYGTDCNGVDQPFITAPGHYVISSVNGYDQSSGTYSMTFNGTKYYWDQMSGTSMATPVAAGVVVLYLQADPTLDVDRVKEVIAETASSYSNPQSPAKQRGHGIINALAGIEYILQHQGPTISANPKEIAFEGYAGETYTKTFTVKGYNLTSDISIAKSGDNIYSITPTTISATDAYNGVDVTVTYAPTAAGTTNATITLTSADAETVNVPITGVAAPRVATLFVNPESVEINAQLDKTVSKTIDLTGVFLEGDVTVTLNDPSGVFTVSPHTIAASSVSENNPVKITVSFISGTEGTYNGTLTFASQGAESKTVAITAIARDGGTASDPYLNIANYATIDEAGNKPSGMANLYKYTEYENNECAWLTMAAYGAYQADAAQGWISATTGADKYNRTWSASSVYQGSSYYFGSNQSYALDGEYTINFFVTNCSKVKLLGHDYSASSWWGGYEALVFNIYECSVNSDGSLSPSSTAVYSNSANGEFDFESSELDVNKVYKVEISAEYGETHEIGFCTPLQSLGTPVATEATEVGTNMFTANWNECAGATSYTLRVVAQPNYMLMLTEGFSKFKSIGGADVGNKLDNYMDNPGWTGQKLYQAVGGVRLGTSNVIGTLISPELDLSQSRGKVSIKIKAKAYETDTNCGLAISCGEASDTITLANSTEVEQMIILDCEELEGQKVSFASTVGGKRVIITGLEIYSGEYKDEEASAAAQILISGITETMYVLTGLEPRTTYIYDVKAFAGNKESEWSNQISVTTLGGIAGDVNGDGVCNAADVTALYNYILNNDDSAIVNGDQNHDGVINAGDVTTVYNIILGVNETE